MSAVGDEVAAVVADITAAGVPATVDPGLVLSLLSQSPAAALVRPPEELRPGLGMASLDMDIPVWLVTRGPDNDLAAERLWVAVLPAMRAAPPLEHALRDTYPTGEVDLPALRWATPRRITYPEPVRSP